MQQCTMYSSSCLLNISSPRNMLECCSHYEVSMHAQEPSMQILYYGACFCSLENVRKDRHVYDALQNCESVLPNQTLAALSTQPADTVQNHSFTPGNDSLNIPSTPNTTFHGYKTTHVAASHIDVNPSLTAFLEVK